MLTGRLVPSLVRRLARRAVDLVFVLFGVATIVFVLLRAIPGDPVLILGGLDILDPAAIARSRATMGLDRPIIEQYGIWLGKAVSGDLGLSLRTGLPVTQLIARAFPVTAELAGFALAIGLAVSVSAGIAAARRAGRAGDVGITLLSIVGISTPPFVLAIALIYVFAVRLHLLPTTGFVPVGESLPGHLRSLVLPSVTLGLVSAGVLVRIMRRSVLDELGQDYVRAARAKGISDTRVVYRHAVRNALIPFITIAGIEAGVLLSGAVIVETIFAVPGLGRLMIDNINQRDYPVVQGAVLVTSLIYVLINALVDVVYAALDPRIRAERTG